MKKNNPISFTTRFTMNGTLPIDIDKYYVYKAQYPHLHHEMIHTED